MRVNPRLRKMNVSCRCLNHVSLFQVATFILQKILLDDTGLAYICQTYERFSHVAMILVINYYSYCLEL